MQTTIRNAAEYREALARVKDLQTLRLRDRQALNYAEQNELYRLGEALDRFELSRS